MTTVPTRNTSDPNASADINTLQGQITANAAAITAKVTVGLPCVVRGNLYVGTNIASTGAIQFAGKLTKIIGNVDTANTGAALEFNIQLNGANDMLNTELSIAAGATSGSSTDIDTDYDDLVQGNYGTLDISQIGSTLPGTTLRVTLIITPS